MDKIGSIKIRIKGRKGNIELSPDNYDIKEIIEILENAESLLFSNEKKNRPTISYSIEEGSVNHILTTSMQYIIGFNALIRQINSEQNIDFLDSATAQAFEYIQSLAIKRDYEFEIKTSLDKSNAILLNSSTSFYRTESIWADAEFYFYGKVTNAGGKEKANIHIITEDLGTVRVDTPKPFLEQYDENMLYKTFGIRAKGKQHSETGEIDKQSLTFIELIDFEPKYDEDYLSNLRKKAKKSWLGSIDPDKWLKEIRGGYDA